MENSECRKTLHSIEYIAGQSNILTLSREEYCLARQMIETAERKLQALKFELWDEKPVASSGEARNADRRPKANGNSIEKEIRMQQELEHLERLRTAIAPHKSLPSDVLCHIFEIASPKHPWELIYPFVIDHTAWRLMRVCSSWRTVIQSQGSRFFNSIGFHSLKLKDPPAKITKWVHSLTTIGNPLAPVSFEIVTPGLENLAHEAIILPFRTRIKELSLSATEEFFVMPQGSFPLLEKLTVNVSLVPYSILTKDSCQCFIGMDRLRSLRIELSRFVLNRNLWPLENFPYLKTVPWSQLLTLKMKCTVTGGYKESMIIPVALQSLQNCSNLENCVLQVQCLFHQQDCKLVHLPRLLTLRIYIGCHPSLTCHGSLLDYLITPSLRSLTIATACDVGPDVSAFLRRSACPLNMLKLKPGWHRPTWAADKTYLAMLEDLEVPRVILVSTHYYCEEYRVVVIKWE